MEAYKKAYDLFTGYFRITQDGDKAKEAALFAVDLILDNSIGHTGGEFYSCVNEELQSNEKYWLAVKSELVKI